MKIEVNLSFNTDDLETFDTNMRQLSQLIDRLLGTPVENAPAIVVETSPVVEEPLPVADEPRDAIVWTEPLRYVAVRLNAGSASWRKLDRPLRKSLAIEVIRNLIKQGYCTMPEFDRRRPAWMPKALSLATSFGLKWTELVDLALPGKVSQTAPVITNTVAGGSDGTAPTIITNSGNGHNQKGGYL